MKNDIITFLANVNIAFVSLVIISFILSFLFFTKKKKSLYLKEIYILFFVVVAWICFYFFNDIFNSIFKLYYFNVKTYLLLLIIVNVITIINVNFVKRLIFKIINYMMFISNVLIFVANMTLFIGYRFNTIDISISDISNLMNVNYIIFFVYLNLIGYLYFVLLIIKKVKTSIIIKRNKQDTVEENNNEKLINEYTVHEDKKIKDIINKLNIKDINKIKLDINKLSLITYDEYNLLKSYLESKNIKI